MPLSSGRISTSIYTFGVQLWPLPREKRLIFQVSVTSLDVRAKLRTNGRFTATFDSGLTPTSINSFEQNPKTNG